jgi:hypothetical protein
MLKIRNFLTEIRGGGRSTGRYRPGTFLTFWTGVEARS